MKGSKKKGFAWLMGVSMAVCSLFTAAALTAPQKEEVSAEGGVRLYQLAPEKRSLMQSNVIRTQNGKLIVIDGGIDGDGLDRVPYLPAALRAIAGVKDGEAFEVEAWFLTHAHKDHFNELAKMLNEYSADSNYKINHFYFDFPDFGSAAYPSDTNDRERLEFLKTGLDQYAEVNNISYTEEHYYDALNGAVINAAAIEEGLELNIDGVRLEIMQTYAATDNTDINNNSLVMRAWVGGQSVLFLGDLGSAGGARLLQKYGEGLKSDIVQMAHHGQAGVRQPVYEAIDAPVHLWCTPIWVWENTKGEYEINENRKWVNGGKDFTTADAYNLVACLYPSYPARSGKAASWAEVIDGMSIPLPYTVEFEEFSSVGEGFMADTEGMATRDEYGVVYSGEDAFRLITDRTVWVDRFGVALRADAEESDGLRLILSSEKNAWYTQAARSLSLELRPVRDGGEIVSTDITLYDGEKQLGQYNSVMFNWTADESYSTNYVYLGRREGKWIININDGVIETDADEALDAALAGFEDGCAFYQCENLGGAATVTLVGIQYGLPAGGTDSPHANFAQGPVLSAPRWTLTEEGELAGWTPDYGTPYTVKSDLELPLNGFGMTLRAAHGEDASAVMFAMTSLYGGADWYAGTYSIVFRIQWDPSFGEDEALVQLMVYTPDTEDTHEEPIKLSANVENFGWFRETQFSVARVRGTWGIKVNGKEIFENKTSSDGKKVDDYLKSLAPYYEGGVGYLQVWEQPQSGGTVTNTGYVIEQLTAGAANAAPQVDAEALSEVVGADYAVGSTLTVELTKLFKDADGDQLVFFATKGTITDGVWTYRTEAPELLFVTFTASDGSKSVQKRVAFSIGTEETAVEKGCGAAAGMGAVVLAAVGAGALTVRRKKRDPEEKDNEESIGK